MAEDKDPEIEGLKDFFDKVLGGEQGAQEILDPMQEVFVGFNEIFKGLQAGGFSYTEAVDIIATYLYKVVSGGDPTP